MFAHRILDNVIVVVLVTIIEERKHEVNKDDLVAVYDNVAGFNNHSKIIIKGMNVFFNHFHFLFHISDFPNDVELIFLKIFWKTLQNIDFNDCVSAEVPIHSNYLFNCNGDTNDLILSISLVIYVSCSVCYFTNSVKNYLDLGVSKIGI